MPQSTNRDTISPSETRGVRYFFGDPSADWRQCEAIARRASSSGIRKYIEIFVPRTATLDLNTLKRLRGEGFVVRVILQGDGPCLAETIVGLANQLLAEPPFGLLITIEVQLEEFLEPVELSRLTGSGIFIDFSVKPKLAQLEINLGDLAFLKGAINTYNSTIFFEHSDAAFGWFAEQEYLSNRNLRVLEQLELNEVKVSSLPPQGDSENFQFNALVLTLTDNCNMTCRHCAPECEPRKSTLDREFFERVITEAASDSRVAKEVSFVGGEPTIYLDDLVYLMQHAVRLGLSPCMTTNGWWGRDEAKCTDYLRKFSGAGLNRMELSVDVFHQEFLDISAIRRILRTSREFGVSVIVRCVVSRSGTIRDCLEGLTGLDLAGHLVASSPVLPFGRALSVIPMDDFYWSDNVEGNCRKSLNLTVRFDGCVTPCCVGTEFVPYLHIGNAKNSEMKSLVDYFLISPKFGLVTKAGPMNVLRSLDHGGKSEINRKVCVGMCDLCISSFANPDIQTELSKFIRGTVSEGAHKFLKGVA